MAGHMSGRPDCRSVGTEKVEGGRVPVKVNTGGTVEAVT